MVNAVTQLKEAFEKSDLMFVSVSRISDDAVIIRCDVSSDELFGFFDWNEVKMKYPKAGKCQTGSRIL